MSNEQLKFWITCPDCKHVFGVEPRAVVQYLNRVLGALVATPPASPLPPEHDPDAPEGTGEAPPKAAPTNRSTSRPAPYRRGRPWQR